MQEPKQRILYLRDVMGLSFRQIEKQTGISRKNVSRIYRGEWDGGRAARISLLDKYRPLITNWFKQYPTLKAKQAYKWLKEREVPVSYPSVVLYTRPFRSRKKQRVYHHLNFLPGEEGQVDWFFLNHPGIGKLACFVLILSYSRYLFAQVFARSQFEFFIQGHLMAFSRLNGTPHSLRYDNLKSVVIKLRSEVVHNPNFLEFCRHYGIKISLCNPGAANEKGRVERAIRTIKEDFFNIATHSSLETLNQGLGQWVEDKNQTIHRGSGARPVDLLKEERLKPLPAIPWENVSIRPPAKTTKTAMMIFDTNAYSVPEYLVGRSLSIHCTPTQVRIYGDKRVASHPRSYERGAQIINPLHRSYSRLSIRAKMQRIYEAIKNLHPQMAQFLLKNQSCGEDPYKTAYEIFKLPKKESRTIIIGIATECIQRRSPRLKTLLSYLYPGPPENIEAVHPRDTELLHINYQPRSLEVYDDTKES